MLGAIVGDIVGSRYEWTNIKRKEFRLFGKDCRFTDDTVMTIAVAEAVMNGGQKDDFIDAMKKYGRMFPRAGYGGRFYSWLFSDNRELYNSFGNGSAMLTYRGFSLFICFGVAFTRINPSFQQRVMDTYRDPQEIGSGTALSFFYIPADFAVQTFGEYRLRLSKNFDAKQR